MDNNDNELLKIPDEVLLKLARREIGELKSYIQELEYELKIRKTNSDRYESLLKKYNDLCNSDSKEIMKSKIVTKLQNNIKILKRTVESLGNSNSDLIYKLNKKDGNK